ncbi:hypothetical protein Tco_0344241 [Tanacetum coccineum]
MDYPNITMEEYIRLEEEKAQRHGLIFNWQTATFGKVKNYEDEDDCFADFDTEFPAIVFDNPITISLDESDDEDYTIIFDENSFSYKIISVNDLKTDSENDKILMPSSSEPTIDHLDDLDYFNDFKNEFPAIVYNDGLTSKPDLEIEPPVSSKHISKSETSLSGYDEEEQNVLHFSNSFPPDEIFPNNPKMIKDSDDDIDIAQPYFDDLTPDMRHDLAVRLRMVYTGGDGQQEFMTWRQFILALVLHTEQEMAEAGFRAYWAGSDRALEKVTGVDLLYLRSMDRGTANVPHLLAQYLFRHAEGRKSGARLSGGHFIGHLAIHFGLVSDEGLRGLQVVTRELPLINVHELKRLNISSRYGDTWAWVALGPERQQVAAAGAHEADEAGPAVDKGAQDVLAPAQAPPQPPPAPQPRTMLCKTRRGG